MQFEDINLYNEETQITKDFAYLIKTYIKDAINEYLNSNLKIYERNSPLNISDYELKDKFYCISREKSNCTDFKRRNYSNDISFKVPALNYCKFIYLKVDYLTGDNFITISVYDDDFQYYLHKCKRNEWIHAVNLLNTLLDFDFQLLFTSLFRKYENNFLINRKTAEITKNTLQSFCNSLIMDQLFIYTEFHDLFADIKRIRNGSAEEIRIIYKDFINEPEKYTQKITEILKSNTKD